MGTSRTISRPPMHCFRGCSTSLLRWAFCCPFDSLWWLVVPSLCPLFCQCSIKRTYEDITTTSQYLTIRAYLKIVQFHQVKRKTTHKQKESQHDTNLTLLANLTFLYSHKKQCPMSSSGCCVVAREWHTRAFPVSTWFIHWLKRREERMQAECRPYFSG